jgi:hypothetical protein
LPGPAGPGREPDKGRDLSTVERTEFRQFGNQGPGDRLSYAGHGSEEILFLDPDGRSPYLTVDQDVQLREFFLPTLSGLSCTCSSTVNMTGLQEVYERRWLKRYPGPVARALCRVHGISIILAHHGSKISKFIAVVFGFLGIKKFTGWFSGS